MPQSRAINDAWLELSTADGKVSRLPVGSFNIRFALNELPALSLVPSLGYHFGEGRFVALGDIKEGMTARLFFQMNGVSRLLFGGFVSKVGCSDTSTVFKRWFTANIEVAHRAIRLAGPPPTSFTYLRRGQSLHDVTQLMSAISYPLSDNPTVKGNVDATTISSWLEQNISANAPLYPAQAITDMAIRLMTNWSPLYTEEEMKTIIMPYNGANMTGLEVTQPTAISQWFVDAFVGNWRNKNVWENLLAAAQSMFLSVVPFNSGFYIANPLALMTVPDMSLAASEYISLSLIRNARLGPPVDGVYAIAPLVTAGEPQTVNTGGADTASDGRKDKGEFAYPPVGKAEGVDSDVTGDGLASTGRYYHTVNMPGWVGELEIYKLGISQPDGTVKQRNLPADGLSAYFQRVGPNIAREMFAQLKLKETAVEMVLPYREDLMPGTVLEIENTDAEAISFLGTTFYGMISTVELVCSNLEEKPQLLCRIGLSAVRTAADNCTPDKGGYCLDKPPIYQARWTPIDIFGRFLKKPPEFTPMSAPGKDNVNDTTPFVDTTGAEGPEIPDLPVVPPTIVTAPTPGGGSVSLPIVAI